MRILLINQYAGAPNLGMEFRPHWMAMEWQRLGHEVLVVTGDQSHLRRKGPPVGSAVVDGVPFLTLRTPRYSQNGPKRFANILAFRAQLYGRRRHLTRWGPDVVIASSTHPMDVRPALRLARSCDALFVHEVHDLWPLTPRLLGGMSDHHPMITWMQREENLACQQADLVVSMLPATLPYLEERGLDPSRWVYIPNGVPLVDTGGSGPPYPPTLQAFRIGYFGGHGVSNDLSTLIEAARLLQSERIEFHLIGSGPLKDACIRQATGLRNVHFHEPVAPEVARSQMGTMHALYLGGKDSPLYRYGVSPNKMFEYMAASRPIIQALSAEASPVELAQCGVLCKPEDPAAVAQAIEALARTPAGQLATLGANGRRYVMSHGSQVVLAQRFIEATVRASTPREDEQ